LLLRIGAARKEAGRAFGFVKIQLPSKDQAVTHDSFRFQLDKDRLKQAEHRDGYYLLRSNLTACSRSSESAFFELRTKNR